MKRSIMQLVLMLGVISIATCRSAGAKRPMQTPGPTLSIVKASVQDRTLRLSYRVSNDTDHPIYLVARLFQRSPTGFVTDPNLVYTEIKDGTLRLTKAMIPVPDTMDVEVPEVPYVVKLDSKKAFDETLQVHVPIEPRHPYAGVKRIDETRTFSRVELVVGWLAVDGIKVDTIARPGAPTELQIHHQAVISHQQLLTAAVGVSLTGHLAPP